MMEQRGALLPLFNKRLTGLSDFYDNFDFIVEACEAIGRVEQGSVSVEMVLDALRKKVIEDNVGLFIQFHSSIPRIFVACYLCLDIYSRRQGVIWLIYARPGANMKSMTKTLEDWFQTCDVVEVFGANVNFNRAKERWYKMNKFNKVSEIYLRKVK